MDYKMYFDGLKIMLKWKDDTTEITKTIKQFTKNFFKKDTKKKVFYSGNNKEFLYDVSVLSFNPENIINSINRKINTNAIFKEYNAFLLLESELGGEGGTSPYGVFKNVLEDFSKLLIGNSKYKIMIMAVSSYGKEDNYIENRLEIMYDIYKRSFCNSDICIIIIEGNHPKGKSEKSEQIKLDTNKMSSYILDRAGYRSN